MDKMKELLEVLAVTQSGEKYKVALQMFEHFSSCSSELFPYEGKERLMRNICEKLSSSFKNGTNPEISDLQDACIQVPICRENYHISERANGYATLADIFLQEAVYLQAKTSLEKHGCVKDKYDLVSDDAVYQSFAVKWNDKKESGWYGIAAEGCPTVWYTVLDEVMTFIASIDEKFSIKQVKLKYGGLRWYVETSFGNVYIQRLLEETLFDTRLCW